VHYGVADPAIFATDCGPSIAERMAQRAVRFKPGDNRRVGKLGAAAGWDLLRQRLVGEEGSPMLYFFDTCVNCIRTIPVMQHDARRPEDMDSSGDDHCADAARYAVASRPWVAVAPEPEVQLGLNFLWRQKRVGIPATMAMSDASTNSIARKNEELVRELLMTGAWQLAAAIRMVASVSGEIDAIAMVNKALRMMEFPYRLEAIH
jgi:hypothetical protein